MKKRIWIWMILTHKEKEVLFIRIKTRGVMLRNRADCMD